MAFSQSRGTEGRANTLDWQNPGLDDCVRFVIGNGMEWKFPILNRCNDPVMPTGGVGGTAENRLYAAERCIKTKE